MRRNIMPAVALMLSTSLIMTGCDININMGDKPSITDTVGGNDTVKNPEVQNDTNGDDKNQNNPDNTNDTKDNDSKENEAIREAFENFMYKGGVAYCGIDGFEGKNYNLNQMIDYETDLLKAEWYSDELTSTECYYDYIDCGLDGIEELVIEVEYSLNPDYDTDLLDKYFIFKVYDGTVTLIDTEEGYYRSWVEITKAGGIKYGGSGGANLQCYSYAFINADGERIFDYSLDSYICLNQALAPYSDIPSSIRPDDYPMENYVTDGFGIECDEYSFVEYDMASFSDFDVYLSNNMYVFVDQDGNDVPVPDRFALFYDEHGILHYTQAEMKQVLDEHEKKIGLADDVKNSENIDLKELLN